MQELSHEVVRLSSQVINNAIHMKLLEWLAMYICIDVHVWNLIQSGPMHGWIWNMLWTWGTMHIWHIWTIICFWCNSSHGWTDDMLWTWWTACILPVMVSRSDIPNTSISDTAHAWLMLALHPSAIEINNLCRQTSYNVGYRWKPSDIVLAMNI